MSAAGARPPDPACGLPLSPLTRRRTTAAWLVLVLGLPLVIGLTAPFNDEIGVAAELLSVLLLVRDRGHPRWQPSRASSAPSAAALAANFFLVAPTRTLTINDPENALALGVFLAVAAIVSTLVDRVARRSLEARQARRDAEALARSATTLATHHDPLPFMLADLRATLGLDAVSVLSRGESRWKVVASAGEPVPQLPTDGERHSLDDDGDLIAVLGAVP